MIKNTIPIFIGLSITGLFLHLILGDKANVLILENKFSGISLVVVNILYALLAAVLASYLIKRWSKK